MIQVKCFSFLVIQQWLHPTFWYSRALHATFQRILFKFHWIVFKSAFYILKNMIKPSIHDLRRQSHFNIAGYAPATFNSSGFWVDLYFREV